MLFNLVGTVYTTFMTELKLKLPGPTHMADINTKCHLTNNLLNYDLIFRRNILHELGLIFYFNSQTITRQEVSISMEPPN